jgi:hypothetical protein
MSFIFTSDFGIDAPMGSGSPIGFNAINAMTIKGSAERNIFFIYKVF